MFLKQLWNVTSSLTRNSFNGQLVPSLWKPLPFITNRFSNSLIASNTTNESKRQGILANVNNLLQNHSEGRLFAVVHVCGKQFKITAGDIIIIEGYWPPTCSDKISLDKVLVAGGEDFSLIGRPILRKGLVNVEATVIEKALSHTRTHFRKKRRKQYMRINFYRQQHTMLMINSIDICDDINRKSDNTNTLRIF